MSNSIEDLKDAIISNISHELRTPLVSIRGYAEILKSGSLGHINERQEKSLGIILRNVDKLVNIVTDLLDYSNIVSSRDIILKKEIFSIYDLFNELLPKLQPFAEEKKIEFILQIDATIMIEADKSKIERILYNIIHNSIKFNRESGTIKIICSRKHNSLYLEITDSGIGIPKEKIDKISEGFFQVDNSNTRKYDGTGLGLTIVKNFVYMHKGNFKIESDIKNYTKITIEMPVIITRARMEQSIVPMLSKKLFLVFCVDSGILNKIRKLLSECGFNTIFSDDPKEAPEIITKYNPDFILYFTTFTDNCFLFPELAVNSGIPALTFTFRETAAGQELRLFTILGLSKKIESSQLKFNILARMLASIINTADPDSKTPLQVIGNFNIEESFWKKNNIDRDIICGNCEIDSTASSIIINSENGFDFSDDFFKILSGKHVFYLTGKINVNQFNELKNIRAFNCELTEDSFIEFICRMYLLLTL